MLKIKEKKKVKKYCEHFEPENLTKKKNNM